MTLGGNDTTNEWLAYGQKQVANEAFPFLPSLTSPSSFESRNGTFSTISKQNPHLQIPELELTIANMYSFMSYCHREPFVRVFDLSSLPSREIILHSDAEKLVDTEWTRKPHEREVMPTTSFGAGRQRLDVCVRNEEVKEEDLVPFRS